MGHSLPIGSHSVCSTRNIISADPSGPANVVVVQPPPEGRLSFETTNRVLFEIRQGQMDAFEILQVNIHALLATGYRPTPVFQSFERLEGLLDRPIFDVRMDELYTLDEDDRRSFCRLKCLPATADKLALRRHVYLASKAYICTSRLGRGMESTGATTTILSLLSTRPTSSSA